MPSGERAKREYSNLSHAQSRPQRSHTLTLALLTLLLICAPTILSGVLDRQAVSGSAARPVSAGVRKSLETSQDNKALQLTTSYGILHSTLPQNCSLVEDTTNPWADHRRERQLRPALKVIVAVPSYRYPMTLPSTGAGLGPEKNTRTCQHQVPHQSHHLWIAARPKLQLSH